MAPKRCKDCKDIFVCVLCGKQLCIPTKECNGSYTNTEGHYSSNKGPICGICYNNKIIIR